MPTIHTTGSHQPIHTEEDFDDLTDAVVRASRANPTPRWIGVATTCDCGRPRNVYVNVDQITYIEDDPARA